MNYTQNQRINQIKPETLVIGVDIAKEEHATRAFDYRGRELGKTIYFKNNIFGFESFKKWFLNLLELNDKEDIIIGLEPTGHYWLTLHEYLTGKGFKVVTVNPHHVKTSKELDDNSPTKCDKKDAKVIAKLVKDGRFSVPNIPEGKYSEIRIAVNHREQLLTNLNRVENSITRWLDIYFPEFKDVFKSWDGKSALLILEMIPFPYQIIKKNPEEIVEIWRDHGIKRGIGIKRAIKLHKAAKKSVGLTKGHEMAKIQLKDYLRQYNQFKKQKNRIETKIEDLLETISGAKEMLTIPGVGEMTVAGFYAECGNLEDYQHPKQIIKLAGLNLMEHSSGKHKGETTITKRGRPGLRALLYRVSLPLVRHNYEFKQLHKYYTTRSKNPLAKQQSLIALCCKLIKILFTLGTRKVKYDGEKMLNDIKRPKEYRKAA
jgi:transposase